MKIINSLLDQDFRTNLGSQVLSYNNKAIENVSQLSEYLNSHFLKG